MVQKNPNNPYKEAPEDIKKIMEEVLRLEKELIYQNRPRLKSEIINIIKEAIRYEA